MDRKRILWITLIVIGALALLYILMPKPCGYENYAWGAQKRECSCIGIKTDTSCSIDNPDGTSSPCPDAGASTACIGVVASRSCFNGYPSVNGTQWIPCGAIID